ncbi:MAG: hypothetical protein ACOY3Z_05725 [Thermodesulfobacteriota bacterium]
MSISRGTMAFILVILSSILVTSMDAFGFLGLGNSTDWKEEVLLHDGRKIIVERAQVLGGYPTLDSRERMTLEEEWTIPAPETERKIIWKTGFHPPPKGPCLMLVLVGFSNDVPYIATAPAGCLAYNHWGRPNPPYVFFKYDGKDWQRIPLEEFPPELKEVNVAVGRPDPQHRSGLLSIATIKEENRNLEPHLRQIVREVITSGDGNWRCPEMEYDGKGSWRSPGGAKAPHPISRQSPATGNPK